VFIGAPAAAIFWYATYAYNDSVTVEVGAVMFIVVFHVGFFVYTQFNRLLLADSELRAHALYRALYPILVSVYLLIVWVAYHAGGETVSLSAVICAYLFSATLCIVLQKRQLGLLRLEAFTWNGTKQLSKAFRPRFVWFGEMLMSVNRNIDKVLLSVFVSSHDLAFYGIGFALSRSLNGLQYSVANAFYANSYTDLAARRRRMLLGLAVIASIGIAALFLFILVGDHLLRVLFGEPYAASNVLCWLLIVEATFASMGRLISEVLISTSKTTLFFYRQVAIFFITIPAVWFSALYYGAIGTAGAVAFTSLLGLFVAIGMSRGASPTDSVDTVGT